MAKKLRIVLAQLNFLVGDIQGNLTKHIHAAIKARDELQGDLVLFPELSLTGYPPEDLLLRPSFIVDAEKALQELMVNVSGIYCIIGHPQQTLKGLFNACSLIYNGKILKQYAKQNLPNYGVFDEQRYFVPGFIPCTTSINDIPFDVVICEDLWSSGPVQLATATGARLILSPNASPFETDKHESRLTILKKRAEENHVPIVYVNSVGGQDELIFDGGSMVIDAEGKLCQCAGFFNETLFAVDLEMEQEQIKIAHAPIKTPNQEERIYQGLVLAVRDYVKKNNFKDVIIGVSGGIDSALTLAIAVDALGSEHVYTVMMPSRYTAQISIDDAKELTNAFHVKMETISIEPSYKSFLESLTPQFTGKKSDVTEENIQARCRAIILSALSNKFGYLILTTGNRSEMAVGYCTIYGDMAGGFAVLKDVPKTLVYKLAAYRNSINHVIPERILKRAPTAELAPNQKDEDTLPPYSLLDQILEYYLHEGKSIDEIIAKGLDPVRVKKVVKLIHQNEYKRRQSAIGPRINHKSFGRDWRYPVSNGYKG